LDRTLRSAQGQRGIAFEVIVVDDGSSKGTGRVVTTLGDDRVRIVRTERPSGAALARNLGAAEATGRWLAFLDDDDLWSPDKLAQQVEALSTSGSSWAYSGAVFINQKGQIRGGAPPPGPEEVTSLLPRYNPIPAAASNVIVAADVIAEAGGFDPDLLHMADWDLWIRIATGWGPPACVPAPAVAYRLHGGNFSVRPGSVRREIGEMQRRYPTVDSGRIFRHMGSLAIGSGRWSDGLRLLWTAALQGPTSSAIGELMRDGRLVLGTAMNAASRRLGRDPARAELRRHDRLVRADPNRAYKDEARTWLSDVTRVEDLL
jgi:glycosyltransferase involved in cell wall biosynthesis